MQTTETNGSLLFQRTPGGEPARNADLDTVSCAPWSADGSFQDLPRWAAELCGEPGKAIIETEHHTVLETTRPGFTHRSCTLKGAVGMDATTFTKRAVEAYDDLLQNIDRRRIFRMWNFIPGINEGDTSDQDRYMRFNAARFDAFNRQPTADHPYPPASGVGHGGHDLILHLMAGDITVETIDNPRQTLPEDYSKTWGLMPPVFTRSALIHGLEPGPLLVVSGTASVRGEDTMHEADVDQQLDETIRNIEELLRIACPGTDHPKLDSMLVYIPEQKHLDHLRTRITSELAGSAADIEYRLGKLCRKSLLVEIEGTRRMVASTT
jgi:hypothetical protein